MGILNRAAVLAFALTLLTIAGPLLHGQAAYAQVSSSQIEKKVKAGLIYNFLKYTDWPAQAMNKGGQIRLCLLGPDPFDGALEPLEGRTAQNKTITILRVETAEEGKNCHLLFIHRNLHSSLGDYLTQLAGYPVLLVSDMQSFSHQGGMVELATENGYINMHVNKSAVRESGLAIQDRLLKLAKNP